METCPWQTLIILEKEALCLLTSGGHRLGEKAGSGLGVLPGGTAPCCEHPRSEDPLSGGHGKEPGFYSWGVHRPLAVPFTMLDGLGSGMQKGRLGGDPCSTPVLGPLTISSEPAPFTLLLRARGWREQRGPEGALTQASGVLSGRQDAVDLREHPHSFIFPTIWPLVYQLIKTHSLAVATPSGKQSLQSVWC